MRRNETAQMLWNFLCKKMECMMFESSGGNGKGMGKEWKRNGKGMEEWPSIPIPIPIPQLKTAFNSHSNSHSIFANIFHSHSHSHSGMRMGMGMAFLHSWGMGPISGLMTHVCYLPGPLSLGFGYLTILFLSPNLSWLVMIDSGRYFRVERG